MQDISAFGTEITVVATKSYPLGFKLTKFADDEDPIKVEEVEPNGFVMLYDGSLFAYSKAAPIVLTVFLIPGSEDDINCKLLLQASKGSASIIPVPDVTSMVISYPGGGRIVLSNGTIIKGMLADSVNQTGRFKGNPYTFAFGSFAGAQNARELVGGIINAIAGLF